MICGAKKRLRYIVAHALKTLCIWKFWGTTLQWEIARYAVAVAGGELSFRQWELRSREIMARWQGVFDYAPLRERLLALDVPEITEFVEGIPRRQR